MPRNLTLFDLDNTLLPLDSDYEWGEFICRHGVVDVSQYRRENEQFFAQYRAGTLDMRAYLAFGLAPLTRHSRSELDALHRQFMAESIAPAIRISALELVAMHQKKGDLCAIITATNAFVTGPIATAFGVEHLIASIPEQQDGRFTGAVRGMPAFREGKITRTELWLESLGLAWESFPETTFYSDSHNDLPLLERVSSPVASNPDEMLRAVAVARKWRILELFNDQ